VNDARVPDRPGALAAPAPAGRGARQPAGAAAVPQATAPERAGAPAGRGDLAAPPAAGRATRPDRQRRRAVQHGDDEAARAVERLRGTGRLARARAALAAHATALPLARAISSVTGRGPMPRARRNRRRVGVGRLVCWELVVVALLASVGGPRAVKVATVAAAVAVFAATTIRIRDRFLYEWFGRGVRYVLRRGEADLVPDESGPQDLLGHLAPHARIETVDVDGIPVAFICRPEGVAAVLEMQDPAGPTEAIWASVMSVPSLLPLPDANAPPFAAQVVMHTTPADLGVLTADAMRLTQRAWVTMQAVRTADFPDDDTLRLALANAVHRLVRRLARDDVATRTLDREETLALIAGLAQLEDVPDSLDPMLLTERWGGWQAGATVHACFRLGHWGEADAECRRLVLRRLQLIPSRGTTIAITVSRRNRRGDAETDTEVIVRLTETDSMRLDNSANLLEFALEDVGIDLGLERLDGEHQTAVAASLPLGVRVAAL